MIHRYRELPGAGPIFPDRAFETGRAADDSIFRNFRIMHISLHIHYTYTYNEIIYIYIYIYIYFYTHIHTHTTAI